MSEVSISQSHLSACKIFVGALALFSISLFVSAVFAQISHEYAFLGNLGTTGYCLLGISSFFIFCVALKSLCSSGKSNIKSITEKPHPILSNIPKDRWNDVKRIAQELNIADINFHLHTIYGTNTIDFLASNMQDLDIRFILLTDVQILQLKICDLENYSIGPLFILYNRINGSEIMQWSEPSPDATWPSSKEMLTLGLFRQIPGKSIFTSSYQIKDLIYPLTSLAQAKQALESQACNEDSIQLILNNGQPERYKIIKTLSNDAIRKNLQYFSEYHFRALSEKQLSSKDFPWEVLHHLVSSDPNKALSFFSAIYDDETKRIVQLIPPDQIRYFVSYLSGKQLRNYLTVEQCRSLDASDDFWERLVSNSPRKVKEWFDPCYKQESIGILRLLSQKTIKTLTPCLDDKILHDLYIGLNFR